MRIAHVLTRLLHGGSEETTIATCIAQTREGHQVYLIHGRDYIDDHCTELAGHNIKSIKIDNLVQPIRFWDDVVALCQLTSVLRGLGLDVVHTHQSKAGILGRMAARLAGVPIIVHGVHILAFVDVSRWRALAYVAAERFCGNFTHLFIHVSPQMREECEKRSIGSRAQHVIIESGMDVDRFRNGKPPHDGLDLLESPTGSDVKPFVILFLGALEKRKGHAHFLPVFKDVVSERSNTILLIAGEGEQRHEVGNDIQRLNLNSHVRLLGFRSDPESLLAISDVLIICSEREGLPRAALQAAIAGVPILTTPLPGIEAIVRQWETGSVSNLVDFKSALLRLIDEPGLRLRMKKNLQMMNYTAFDNESMTRKIQIAYKHQFDKLTESLAYAGGS
jgi:glycosyltransferase involved in cell wall biosynthesis